mmetsp:Transcript_126686/g.370160  ORF Transcript_126686/g.370160 Transcript_126686/m.370160 type:complete len:325 (-) Transcript_126686:100-1074(-)
MGLAVLCQARHGERAGGLQDHARVDERVLDGGADLVSGHVYHLIHHRRADPEGLVPHAAHGGPVREEAHRGQLHDLAGLEAPGHGGGVAGLDAEDLDRGLDGLQEDADASSQAPPAHAGKHPVHLLFGGLREDLLPDGALPRDDQRVVEGVHQDPALRLQARLRGGVGLVVGVAAEDHLGLLVDLALDGVHLDLGRGPGHEDLRGDAQRRCREGHALCVVPRRTGADATRLLLCAQVCDLVVRAPDLEAVDLLLVLPLQEDLVACRLGELRRVVQLRKLGDIVDPRVQHQADVLEVLPRFGAAGAGPRAEPAQQAGASTVGGGR